MVTLPPNIIDIEDHEESLNLLVYGKSGVGKTTFGGSGDDVLFIAVENGTVSAKRQGSKAKIWKVEKWSDIVAAYEWLSQNPDHGFRWVVLDSITQMQQMCMRAILGKAAEENSSRDPDLPQIQDYQKYYNMFERFVLAFCDLPTNVLFTALIRNVQDQDKNDFVLPDIKGRGYQMAQYVCGMMSSFGCLEVKKVQVKNRETGETTDRTVRVITWEDTGTVQGKDRYGVLAPRTINKTLAQIDELITGKPVGEKVVADPNAKRKKTEDLKTGVEYDDESGLDDVDLGVGEADKKDDDLKAAADEAENGKAEEPTHAVKVDPQPSQLKESDKSAPEPGAEGGAEDAPEESKADAAGSADALDELDALDLD